MQERVLAETLDVLFEKLGKVHVHHLRRSELYSIFINRRAIPESYFEI